MQFSRVTKKAVETGAKHKFSDFPGPQFIRRQAIQDGEIQQRL